VLTVASGVEPGVPVVFDLSQPNQVTLRPAAKGESATEPQPWFTFEWQEDKTARFYRLPDPALLARLSAENERDSADAEGKKFEQRVVKQYLQDGAVLRACLPPSKPGSGTLTFYIVVSATGSLENAIVLPQGAVSECILEQAKTKTFDAPANARSFTAMARINVTE
jgi:hypothetical protein